MQKKKTIVAMRGRNPDNPSDRTVGAKTEQRLEPNEKDMCNTITTVQKDNLLLEAAGECEEDWELRKLIPRETGRLMGVSDENITKMQQVNSDTQLYKQFGNSIVVSVQTAMFSNLNIKGCRPWSEIKDKF